MKPPKNPPFNPLTLSSLGIGFLVMIALFLLWKLWSRDKRVMVQASNGKGYLVVPGANQQQKAEALAIIDSRVQKLLDAMNMGKELSISENDDFREYVAFTLNKTDIRLCLKTLDINTLMFVTMHELAHAFCKDNGHSDSFWNLFSLFLQKAISLGVYEYQDFAATPEPYCGEMIQSTPYQCTSCSVYRRT